MSTSTPAVTSALAAEPWWYQTYQKSLSESTQLAVHSAGKKHREIATKAKARGRSNGDGEGARTGGGGAKKQPPLLMRRQDSQVGWDDGAAPSPDWVVGGWGAAGAQKQAAKRQNSQAGWDDDGAAPSPDWDWAGDWAEDLTDANPEWDTPTMAQQQQFHLGGLRRVATKLVALIRAPPNNGSIVTAQMGDFYASVRATEPNAKQIIECAGRLRRFCDKSAHVLPREWGQLCSVPGSGSQDGVGGSASDRIIVIGGKVAAQRLWEPKQGKRAQQQKRGGQSLAPQALARNNGGGGGGGKGKHSKQPVQKELTNKITAAPKPKPKPVQQKASGWQAR